jgi:outer membrane cobalamin receptor
LGRHQQSQYINEINLEEQNPQYYDLSSADMAVLELNKTFANSTNLRIEVYQKEYSQTLPYFENLFNGLHIVPDLYFDRIKISPEDSYSTGLEATLKGRYGDVQWLVNYTFSDVEDEFEDGNHSRSWDQHHALKLSLHMPIKSWFLDVSGNFHSPWPRTKIITTANGLQIGVRNEDSYASHFQLNAKLSRNFKIYNGLLKLSVQANNLVNNFNPCCVNYSLEGTQLEEDQHQWLPFTPNMSVVYQWD